MGYIRLGRRLTCAWWLVSHNVSASARIFDDALLQCPVGQVLVFSLLFGLNNISGEMATNVLHAIIPAAFTFKDSATETAGAALGRFSLLNPATLTDGFKTVFKGLPICTGFLTGSKSARTRTGLGLVHATMMLSEEVFAVEVVVDALVSRNTGVEFWIARTNITPIEA